MMNNYVKFMRGTPKAFAALAVKDNNTLYFISETDANSGKLYLGEKEIVCDNNSVAATFLKDLLDVDLPENPADLKDGQVLTYDANSGLWVARDPAGIAEIPFDDNQFELTDNGELSIIDFAKAENGAQLVKGADGKLSWIKPNTETVDGLSTAVETLRNDVDELAEIVEGLDTPEEIDTKISEAIAAVNHLSYKIVESTEGINPAEAGADKFIYLVKNGDIYDEYMVVNGALEKVGDWNVDLSNYATKDEVAAVDTKVDDIATLLNGVSEDVEEAKTNIANISTTVGELAEQLSSANSNVVDLTDALNSVKALAEANKASIDEIIVDLDSKVDKSVYDAKMAEVDEDMAEMRAVMSWNQLEEPAE